MDQTSGQDVPFFAKEASAVLADLESGPGGLSIEDAAARLAKFGPNRLPTAPPTPAWLRFLRQFNSAFIYVLLLAAAVTTVLGETVDTAVILAVVLGNALIGYLQEGKAERALDAISAMLAPQASALRDNKRVRLPATDLVSGDVVLLEAGDRVPADLRVLESWGLRVEEAALTGESVAVSKTVAPVAGEAALGDRRSALYSATLVAAGQGRGVVVATGGSTELGKVTGLLRTTRQLTSPLIRRMDRFAKILTASILAVCALVFAFGFFVHGASAAELFIAVVGIAVAAIPEGLPAVITITLALGAQTMANRRAIVRKLPAIETLGSVSVICTDKTGTLTQNRMAVVTVSTASLTLRFDDTADTPADGGTPTPSRERLDEGLVELARAAALANDAERHRHDGSWIEDGDPMETALLGFAHRLRVDPASARQSASRLAALPFSSETRLMATLHATDGEGGRTIYLKGAPDRILELCDRVMTNGGTGPLDAVAWHRKCDAVAAKGQRVLAFAKKPAHSHDDRLEIDHISDGCTLLGFVGLADPPRHEAIAAVAACRTAGNRVKMITGDHAVTARAIAVQVGLENTDAVLTGADLDKLDDEALARRASDVDVFARTTPQHKLRLVEALQRGGAIVAMTGDGVNDAPALKRADIGVAMGQKGTEAAKEAADLVLADDNFATIAAAVAEGRRVFDNLVKTIAFMLPTNAGEALVLIAAILANVTSPMTPVQILWVNLVTAITLALALAFEPAEPDVMRRPPRSAKAPLLDRRLAVRTVLIGGLCMLGVLAMFALARAQGLDEATSRTVATNTLVAFEIAYLLHIRRAPNAQRRWRDLLGTRAVAIAVAVVIVFQIAFTYAWPLQAVFETVALGPGELGWIVLAGVGFFALMDLYERVERLVAVPRIERA